MNILIISRADHTGAGYALMQAINEHTEHKARAICYKRTWLEYPVDIFRPSPQQLAKWAKWADVVNFHSDVNIDPVFSGKPTVMTYHGSYYRKRWQELNKRDKLRGYVQTALTVDLAMHGPRWIGRAMPDLSYMWKPADEFTVVHSPSQPARKGTTMVKQACAELGVKLDVITGVPWKECLQRKAKGHVLVDQVGPAALGYGTSAIEAWAMGMPVLSSMPEAIALEMIRQWSDLPFFDVGLLLPFFKSSVETARRYWDPNVYQRGRLHWGLYHRPGYVATETVKACKEAMNAS